MSFAFTKATKEKAKLRLAVFGPSGSGKTFTSLRIASGISDKIAFIDTERGSASKYADRFDFDVLELVDRKLDNYIAAIQAAAAAGYDVLIIDSLTHGWKELIDDVEKLARSKYKGNTWSAWSEGTPKQMRFIDAILDYSGHIIATMRTKTEWTTETTSNGRSRPVRVGLAPEQGKGIEYEFDLLMELTTEHYGSIIKDRTGKFQDQVIEKPGEDFGKQLVNWLNDGTEPTPTPHWIDDKETEVKFWNWIEGLSLTAQDVYKALNVKNIKDYEYTKTDAKNAIEAYLDKKMKQEQVEEAVKDEFDNGDPIEF